MSEFHAQVIALPLASKGPRLVPARPGNLVPFRAERPIPPRVPFVEIRTTDPRQQIVRIADNAFHLLGDTADGPNLQTLAELIVEGHRIRVLLGRRENASQTAHRIASAVPYGFRAQIADALPFGSVILTIERDDETRREPAAA